MMSTSPSIARSLRTHLVGITAAAVAMTALSGCYSGIQPDPNPPRVYVLKFERNPDGTEGSQTNIPPGGMFSVSGSWLGPNQADIRVYGDGTYGVKDFTVTGYGVGYCTTKADSMGQIWTSPSPLTATLPTYSETAPAGTVRQFMAVNLDASYLTGNSCGKHSYQGPPPNLEYFLDLPATWTINATTHNGSNLQATGTFTINVTP